ncbi:MAG: DNA methyltransferase [Candidatus Omnitrophota bacterium]|jgi:hypothetical protein
MYQVICTDALTLLDSIDYVRMIFVDPPDTTKRSGYMLWLADIIEMAAAKSDIFWLSYNSKWTFEVGAVIASLLHRYEGLQAKPCVQIYEDKHRPLIRITQSNVELYPTPDNQTLSDVFVYPRISDTLIERCVRLCCKPYDTVVDPFAGNGTTLRVCKRLGISCTTGDIDPNYCKMIAEENGLQPAITKFWPAGRWYGGKGIGLAHAPKELTNGRE